MLAVDPKNIKVLNRLAWANEALAESMDPFDPAAYVRFSNLRETLEISKCS